MASVEEVVLYDLEETDDPDTLIAMLADPQTRWYAKARLAGLSVKGMVSAAWNPHLHPRGRDGKFIRKFGWVRWLKNGRWHRGQVSTIDPDDGWISIKPSDPSDGISFNVPGSNASKTLYSAPPTKAAIDLPDPKHGVDAPGFTKVGGQGGSNPGGRYKIGAEFGGSQHLDLDAVEAIAGAYNLDDNEDAPDGVPVAILRGPDGRLVLADKGTLQDVDGITVTDFDIDDVVSAYTGANVLQAWGDIAAEAHLLSAEDQVYVKTAKSKDHAANELLANRLYELAGVNVAEVIPGKDSTTLGSKLVPFDTSKVDLSAAVSANDTEALAKVRRDFAIDAWLANWDVVGLGLENIQIVDGEPYRIDAGGALAYRAQGASKGQMFGSHVGELHTMKDPSVNSQAAKVFGKVTDAELADGAERLAAIDPAEIMAISEGTWPAHGTQIGNTLIARRADILDALNIEDPYLNAPKVPDTPDPDSDIDLADENPYGDWWTSPTGNAALLDVTGTSDDFKIGIYKDSDDDTFGWTLTVTPTDGDGGQTYTTDGKAESMVQAKSDSIDEYQAWVAGEVGPDIPQIPLDDDDEPSTVDVPDAETTGFVPSPGWGSVWKDGQWTPADGLMVANAKIAYENAQKIIDDDFTFSGTPAFLDALYDDPTNPQDGYLILGGQLQKITGHPTGTSFYTAPVNSDGSLGPETLRHVADIPYARSYASPVDGPDNTIPFLLADLAVLEDKAISTRAQYDLLTAIQEVDPADFPEGVLSVWPPINHEVVEGALTTNTGKRLLPKHAAGKTLYLPSNDWPNSLYVVESVNDETHEATITNAITGEPYGTFDADLYPTSDDSWVLNTDDPYTFEFVDAWTKFQKSGAETPANDTPNPVDPEVVAALDKKEKLTQVESEADTTAASSGLDWLKAGNPVGSPVKILNTFTGEEQDYGTVVSFQLSDQGSPSVTIEKTNALGENFTASYGLEGFSVVPFDTPDADLPTPEPPPVDNYEGSIPNVNAKLGATGPPIKLGDFDTETKKQIVEAMVGKVYLLRSPAAASDNDDVTIIPKGGFSTSLFYVEGFNPETGHIDLRAMNGSSLGVSMNNLQLADYEFIHADNFDAASLKATPNPVYKKDGTIMVAGKQIGTWDKGGNYWSNQYQYTIDAEFSPTGKPSKGTSYNQSGMKEQVGKHIIPVAVETKAKKGTPAVAKVAKTINVKPGAKLSDGTDAELGQWVKSTKGGGGFVGKIVGWPDQETYPGLAFAVDVDGVQKAIKLKTQKKVDGPSAEDVPNLPSAYTGLKLADGKTPQVGQKVKAGKAGAEVEGIITNINVEQGWVYIQKPDGKQVSKTFSVTSVVEEPDLIWNVADAVAAATLDTTPAVQSPSKGKVKFPGPDGAVLTQNPNEVQAYLDANPQRDLTKDGFMPTLGMNLVNNKGAELFVLEIPGEWSSTPNKLKVWNTETGKVSTATAGSVWVNHAKEVSGFDGKPLKKISTLHLNNVEAYDDADKVFPDGTLLYRMGTVTTLYKEGKYRYYEDWTYVAVDPGGKMHFFQTNYGHKSTMHSPYDSLYWLKGKQPKSFEKVAVFDSATEDAIAIQPHYTNTKWDAPEAEKNTFHPSTYEFLHVGAEPANPIVNQPKKSDHDVDLSPPEIDEPEITAPEVDETPEVPTPEPTVDAPEPPTPDEAVDQIGPATDPQIVPATSISTLVPPPQPVVTQKAPDPQLPVVTDEVADLTAKPEAFVGTPVQSVAEAAQKMIDIKDSTDPGTALTYATGDSDYIEDMAIRYNVVKNSDGTESLVARFRLREDVSEDVTAKLMTAGSGKTGAWKLQNTAWPMELEPGQPIAIYLSGHTKFLKPEGPQHELDEPNARVVSKAVLVGKSPTNPDRDLYRIKIQTEDGQIGEVDVEHRETSSIKVFEYDPLAPPKATGKSLKLTPTASEVGWVKQGGLTVRGSQGSVQIDASGKASYTNGSAVTDLAKGQSRGHYLVRTMDDGSTIRFNGVHQTESGTGFDTTRRANIAGEVQIEVPIVDGKPDEESMKSVSRAMQAVGVPVEKQGAPTNEQITNFALAKLVTNYHPKYEYRSKPITGPDDKRVQETLAYMSKELKPHLGRDVTLDDLRIHTHSTGRIQVVLSPEVAKAIGKRQGNHHFMHSGASGNRIVDVLSGTANGLMSTDERWSMGVLTTGQSSHADMTIGSGDRVYTRAKKGADFDSGYVVFNPVAMATSTEVYTEGSSDHYGRRNTSNLFLTHGGYLEYMYKRRFEPEQITFYIAQNENDRADLIAKIKKRGVTHVGGRAIEDIIVTKSQAQAAGNFDSIGEDFWADDIPITEFIGGDAGAPV